MPTQTKQRLKPNPNHGQGTGATGYASLLHSVKGIAASLRAVNRQAIREYTPVVEAKGLVPYGVYYVAVVAEDVLGQINPVVRSQSAQASVDRMKEVRGFAAQTR